MTMSTKEKWHLHDDVLRLLASLDAGASAGFIAASFGLKEKKVKPLLDALVEGKYLRESAGVYAVADPPKEDSLR